MKIMIVLIQPMGSWVYQLHNLWVWSGKHFISDKKFLSFFSTLLGIVIHKVYFIYIYKIIKVYFKLFLIFLSCFVMILFPPGSSRHYVLSLWLPCHPVRTGTFWQLILASTNSFFISKHMHAHSSCFGHAVTTMDAHTSHFEACFLPEKYWSSMRGSAEWYRFSESRKGVLGWEGPQFAGSFFRTWNLWIVKAFY